MAVERENVETLMEWLAEGGPVRSAFTGADTLVEKLAAVVFDGESGWVGDAGRVDAYRDGLREWFADDSGREQQFTELTSPDADPGMLVDWFLPIVLEWEERAAAHGTDAAAQDEGGTGWANANYDGTSGTEYYRLDATTQEYLYAASADGPDWATYEQRRYSEPARDDAYGLVYRYDRRGGAYEWLDEATGTWHDQAWADEHTAAGPEPAWDPNWNKFYRVGPDGGYEFADAVVPGQSSSGCGGVWVPAEALADESGPAPEPDAEALEALRTEIGEMVRAELAEMPDHGLTGDDITAIVADLTREAISNR
ncbi:hypothetical protein ACIRQQ_03090 [Streptomyces fuscichromogenes]|uniref:hypothetical protein n=1 Tax=Streptomyces fuscichromogenes TaxID=1324013 RepID=UPI00380B6DF0